MTFVARDPMLAGMAAPTVPLQLLRRFIAPLLLLMISAHALLPLGQPLQRVSGSAFSAETVEVSLRSGERGQLIKRVVAAPEPALTARSTVAAIPRKVMASAPAPAMSGMGPRGPPRAGRESFGPLSPRAPPAA